MDNPFVPVAAICAGLCALLFALMSGLAHATFPSEAAATEQLRVDAEHTPCNASEDVIGQVTAANQNIMAARAYNRIPLFGLGVPDGWDTVRVIPVPQRCPS